jgi:drug/metabolite transporter (DMT)-like permease
MTSPQGPSSPVPAVHSRTAALVLLVVLSLVWGFHWVVVKIGLGYVPPFTYGAIRLATGLATAVVLLGAQRRLVVPPRSETWIILSVGVLQVAGGALIMNLALQVVAAGRSSVLQYTMPLWVAVLMLVFFRVRPRSNEVVGLVLGIAGLVLLLNPAVIDWSSPGEVAGSLALIFNAMLWAGVTIHIKRHTWVLSPLELQPWQLLAALVPAIIGVVVFEPGATIEWGIVPILCLLYSGPLATAFATWASQAITRSLGSQVTATGFLMTPVVGLASGWLVLGEQLGVFDVIAFGLILGGVGVTSLLAKPAPVPPERLPISAS